MSQEEEQQRQLAGLSMTRRLRRSLNLLLHLCLLSRTTVACDTQGPDSLCPQLQVAHLNLDWVSYHKSTADLSTAELSM